LPRGELPIVVDYLAVNFLADVNYLTVNYLVVNCLLVNCPVVICLAVDFPAMNGSAINCIAVDFSLVNRLLVICLAVNFSIKQKKTFVRDDDIQIFSFQETLLREDESFNILGFNVIRIDGSAGHGGTLLGFKNGVKFKEILTLQVSSFELIGAEGRN
jgi:hypothetical protein